MTLEKAIIHAEAVAKAKEREAKENRNHGGWAYDDEAKKCSACAAEHRQLAEWLKELKERREKDVSDIEDAEYAIEQLPSAQPEIIRCKDCKWWSNDDYRECSSPNYDDDVYVTPAGFYCGYAERRTDE